MATIYEIDMKIISEFVSYTEKDMEKLLKKFINDYIDETTGLGLKLASDIKIVRR